MDIYLHSKTVHLHPQTVCKGLQAPLGHTVGPHVQTGEEGEDAGGVDHPTCRGQHAWIKTELAVPGSQDPDPDPPLLARTNGRKASVVLMEPSRLMSTMLEKSVMVLHSISAH